MGWITYILGVVYVGYFSFILLVSDVTVLDILISDILPGLPDGLFSNQKSQFG
jgi:hypothetical protein